MAFGPKKSDSEQYGSYNPDYSPSSSYFGKSMTIKGEVSSEEDINIEGKVDGKLKVSKTLTIGNNGYVNGDISAAIIRISGEAEGHIIANNKLEISSQGKYSGHIQADTIMVAEGAKLKGTINMEENFKPQLKQADKALKSSKVEATSSIESPLSREKKETIVGPDKDSQKQANGKDEEAKEKKEELKTGNHNNNKTEANSKQTDQTGDKNKKSPLPTDTQEFSLKK